MERLSSPFSKILNGESSGVNLADENGCKFAEKQKTGHSIEDRAG